MRLPAISLFFLLLSATTLFAESTVTVLHFSDYHSHAVPFFESGELVGGLPRLIGFLKPLARRKDTLIFSGGDMMNAGSPSWSDKYQCADWPLLNGIVDAMAFGNHDADYGPEVFERCRKSARFPILGANVIRSDGSPLFAANRKNYLVFRRKNIRIGVFAIAGDDFEKLVSPSHRPAAEARFTASASAAREVVEALKSKERVNCIILIGHEHTEDDIRLAREVPGIDLILGTHSHRKQDLEVVPGTHTYMISPFQYLNYVSRVEMHFSAGRLASIDGRLVPMDRSIREDRATLATVAKMQAALEQDLAYRSFFLPVGSASTEIATRNGVEGESLIGDFVTDVMRDVTKSDIAISAASSFRQALPPGPLRLEDLRASLPYDNKILIYRMTGASVKQLIEQSISRRGSDFFSQVSGIRFAIHDRHAEDLVVSRDGQWAPLRDDGTYTVATTDYQGKIADGYREIFAPFPPVDSGERVRSAVERRIRSGSPITAALDGRIR
ncbi:MAG TPA: bifunctional UDP-sugar hydrolase/5'-nucleotidase [Thermoanaerobaculia bacterium]|nr:bifunctional UDP-sugar hydrolase/5'-nucleotidase [Thermoanaerobaculia bacterium]